MAHLVIPFIFIALYLILVLLTTNPYCVETNVILM